MCVCVELTFVFLATSLTFLALWRDEWQLSERLVQFRGGFQMAVTFPSDVLGELWEFISLQNLSRSF